MGDISCHFPYKQVSCQKYRWPCSMWVSSYICRCTINEFCTCFFPNILHICRWTFNTFCTCFFPNTIQVTKHCVFSSKIDLLLLHYCMFHRLQFKDFLKRHGCWISYFKWNNNNNVNTIPVGNSVENFKHFAYSNVSSIFCIILHYLWKQSLMNSAQAVDVPLGKLALVSFQAILLIASLIFSSNRGGTVFRISTIKHPRDL